MASIFHAISFKCRDDRVGQACSIQYICLLEVLKNVPEQLLRGNIFLRNCWPVRFYGISVQCSKFPCIYVSFASPCLWMHEVWSSWFPLYIPYMEVNAHSGALRGNSDSTHAKNLNHGSVCIPTFNKTGTMRHQTTSSSPCEAFGVMSSNAAVTLSWRNIASLVSSKSFCQSCADQEKTWVWLVSLKSDNWKHVISKYKNNSLKWGRLCRISK